MNRAYLVVSRARYLECVENLREPGMVIVVDLLERDDLPFLSSLPEFQRLFPYEAACVANLERT